MRVDLFVVVCLSLALRNLNDAFEWICGAVAHIDDINKLRAELYSVIGNLRKNV